tara:strand:- start:2012 stop:3037 length:1026 start_codon:yes stop_codon:yes gene_type:complete
MINYNQDIAPLRQQYFPMLSGERGFDAAMKYRQEVVMPMRQQTMKLQQQALAMQQQEMAFEKQQFDLGRAREKAKRESEAFKMAPMIQEKVSSLLDEATGTPAERFAELGKLSVSIAPYLTAGSPLSQMISATGNTIKSQDVFVKEEEAKALRAKQEEERQDQRDLTLVQGFAARGQTDKAQEIAARRGGVSEFEELGMATGTQTYMSGIQEAERREAGARASARQKDVAGYLSRLDKYTTGLSDLGFVETYAVTEGDVTTKPPETELQPDSKAKVIGTLKFLTGLSDDQLEKIIGEQSDIKLINLAKSLIAAREFELTPQPSSSSSSSSSSSLWSPDPTQ